MNAGTASLEEEKKTQTVKDEEAEAVGDSLGGGFGVSEHGGHEDAHDSEHHQPRQEELRLPLDVLEVPALQHPCLGEERVGKLRPQPVVMITEPGPILPTRPGGQVIVLVHRVVTTVGRWQPQKDLTRVRIEIVQGRAAWESNTDSKYLSMFSCYFHSNISVSKSTV